MRLQPGFGGGTQLHTPAGAGGLGKPFRQNRRALSAHHVIQRAVQQRRGLRPIPAHAQRQIRRIIPQASLHAQVGQHFPFQQKGDHGPVAGIGHGFAAGHAIQRLRRRVVQPHANLGMIALKPIRMGTVPLQSQCPAQQHLRRAIKPAVHSAHEDMRNRQIRLRDIQLFAEFARWRHIHQSVQLPLLEPLHQLPPLARMQLQRPAQPRIHGRENIRANAAGRAVLILEVHRRRCRRNAHANHRMFRQPRLLLGGLFKRARPHNRHPRQQYTRQ